MNAVRFLATLIVMLPAAALAGTTTYTYQGAQFTNLANHTTCNIGTCIDYTLTNRMTGSITVNGALAANLSNQDISGLLLSWSYGDGHNTFANTDSKVVVEQSLRVSTNGLGRIVDWFTYGHQWVTSTPMGGTSLNARYNRFGISSIVDSLNGDVTDFAANNEDCLSIIAGSCAVVPTPQTSDSSSAAVITTVGVWTGQGYGITYAGNGNTGGTAPAASALAAVGDAISVSANTGALVKTGFTFSGWNTAADGVSGTHFNPGNALTLAAASVTLYAQWSGAGLAPALQGAMSRKSHGSGGLHDLPLSP
jgi:uncharacterized repeat protein (TIGR02543 family)